MLGVSPDATTCTARHISPNMDDYGDLGGDGASGKPASWLSAQPAILRSRHLAGPSCSSPEGRTVEMVPLAVCGARSDVRSRRHPQAKFHVVSWLRRGRSLFVERARRGLGAEARSLRVARVATSETKVRKAVRGARLASQVLACAPIERTLSFSTDTVEKIKPRDISVAPSAVRSQKSLVSASCRVRMEVAGDLVRRSCPCCR